MLAEIPILYTFVRCPWAMRARLALHYCDISYNAREVDLKNKPKSLLSISPKGTVPVLLLPDGKVLEESIDIVMWAMPQPSAADTKIIDELVNINDNHFKHHNARYKYPDRFPEEGHPREFHRNECEKFIQKLNILLGTNKYLLNDKPSIADIAIFPMIRQFSKVEEDWFAEFAAPNVTRWLECFYASEYYADAMQKHPIWIDS